MNLPHLDLENEDAWGEVALQDVSTSLLLSVFFTTRIWRETNLKDLVRATRWLKNMTSEPK